ncbi:speedy protein 1-A-like [Mixophyes fleayi]|uniref:speedy protein 1-A-like n=1 Tax=Mixophyes fleayi TaxID=3061075 RepID=UPI003F4D7822
MDRRTSEDKLNPAKRIKLHEDQSQHCSTEHSPSLGQEEKAAFYKLLEERTIYSFLKRDYCMRISDKYLLAMVFVYFQRAGLTVSEYTCINFYSALLLAYKMEEEEFCYHTIYTYGARHAPIEMFLKNTEALWTRMQLGTFVTLEQCEEVMRDEHHWAWGRNRNNHHDGAIRQYSRRPCRLCYPPHPFPFPCYLPCVLLWSIN